MEKSIGHIAFSGKFEYFQHTNGNIYRALTSNYIGQDGFRSGARFEAPSHMRQAVIEQYDLNPEAEGDSIPFRVHFTNHGYSSQDMDQTLEEAIEIARKAGFEAGIWQGDNLVATWSILSGTCKY